MRGNLVNNQVGPHLYKCICTGLRVFLFIIFKTPSTHIHTHIHRRTATFKNPNSPFLIDHNHTIFLSIFQSETCFGIPETRAFYTYQNINDPSLFFVRVFRDLWTFRLVLYVILVSKICITDPINLRISRGTTYCNFIEI